MSFGVAVHLEALFNQLLARGAEFAQIHCDRSQGPLVGGCS